MTDIVQYAVCSQLEHHNLKKEDAMVLINPSDADKHYFSTQHILDVIEKHADTTAVLLLPGVHYYSGQFLDIPTITKFAQSKGIIVGWDLAHAVGNVPVKLHDWNVDFAAWCSYKYLNSGPGSIAGLFVHERHGAVTKDGNNITYTPRLSGWWGNDKEARFNMEDRFVPIPGAAGWQLSNPSMLDCTSLLASLSVFNETTMEDIRKKSVQLTGYLEYLLKEFPRPEELQGCYTILTPSNQGERGAQISIRLKPGLLDKVMANLEEQGIVVDDRKPDVIRVAPAPLYNSFADVWLFMNCFVLALSDAIGIELPDLELDQS
jgi:kynureninase